MSIRILYYPDEDKVTFERNGQRIASVSVTPIRDAILERMTGEGISIGADIFSGVSKVAKRLARSKLLRKVKEIVNSPAVEATARTIFPPLGVAYEGVRAADRLVKSARAGDTESLKKIATISAKARQGDPGAKKALNVLKAVNGSKTVQSIPAGSADYMYGMKAQVSGTSGTSFGYEIYSNPQHFYGTNVAGTGMPSVWDVLSPLQSPITRYQNAVKLMRNAYENWTN